MIGIVQVAMQGMADRYSYLPSIGLFVILSWGLADIWDHLELHAGTLWQPTAAILAILGLLTFRQVGFWRTNYDLWAHTLEVTDDNYVADDNMADALMTLGRPEWLQYFQHAASIAPSDAISHEAIAASLEDQGRLREAIPEYEVVIQQPPSARLLAVAYANLGIIYSELGDSANATKMFREGLRTDPQVLEKMVRGLKESVAKNPADEGYLRLGFLLAQSGRLAEARAACQQALGLKPNRAEAHYCLDQLQTMDP